MTRTKMALAISVATILAGSPAQAQSGNPAALTTIGAVDYRQTPFLATADCSAMAVSLMENASIRTAKLVPETDGVPGHCRVDGVIAPEIGFQINLPIKWNGRLYMFGNGGFAGEDVDAPTMKASRDAGIANGFAVARTDTGHLASLEPGGGFARNPGKMIDHAYLAVHKTVQYAKSAIAVFYDRPADYSYWQGCSTGGRQGVMSAQRYPEDFNGIAAAAPTLDWNSIMVKGLWARHSLASVGLTVAKMETVFDAVKRKCDARDGLNDGLIDDPLRCHFDPARDVKACKSGKDGADCLTSRQSQALNRFYGGPRDAQGRAYFHRQPVGAEHLSTFSPFVMMPDGSEGFLPKMADSWMANMVFADAQYDTANFDFSRDPALGNSVSEIMNPKPDLDRFHAFGGKMITYWGWSDTALNPQMGISYYDKLSDRYGADELQTFYRLFLIPGVAHCAGGYGPSQIDALAPVIDWVEKGIAPGRLAARSSSESNKRYSRSYCPYPAQTRYKGRGDPENPENFECME